MENTRIVELRCSICGAKTGEWEAPEGVDATEMTLSDLGISDVRCDDHPPEADE